MSYWQAGGFPTQLPASQQTPPAQLPAPVQPTPHVAPPQLTRPQEITPAQLMVVNVDKLSTFEAHAFGPAQSTEHALPEQVMGCLQVPISVQWIWQSAAVQPIGPLQVVAPVQPIVHLLPPHEMRLAHESAPMQSTLQAVDCEQSTVDPQARAPTHLTAQGIPAGQAIALGQVSAAVHVMVHVPLGVHVPIPASAQRAGQTAAASRPGLASPPPSLASPVSAVFASVPSPSPPASVVASRAAAPVSPAPNVTSGNVHAAPKIMALAVTSTRNGHRLLTRCQAE